MLHLVPSLAVFTLASAMPFVSGHAVVGRRINKSFFLGSTLEFRSAVAVEFFSLLEAPLKLLQCKPCVLCGSEALRAYVNPPCRSVE